MGSGEVAIVALSTMISLKVTFSDGLGGTFKVHPLLEHSINEVDGFLLLLIYDFRIDFSGLNVGVTHQLACGEQVCAKCQHHCAEGVT